MNTCLTCGHDQDDHGPLMGCLVEEHLNRGPGRYCECTEFLPATRPTGAYLPTAVGRTIPSRATDPATSHAAARVVTVKAGTQRAYLLAAFSLSEDLTDEQAADAAEGVTPWSEYAKRCSELRDGGFIQPTGDTRPGQAGVERIVSKITTKGRDALRGLGRG